MELVLHRARPVFFSDLKPRASFVPLILPHLLERCLEYIMSVSLALGVLNMAPIFMLDGEHALGAFLDLLLPRWPLPRRQAVSRVVLIGCSVLFALNIVVSAIALITSL